MARKAKHQAHNDERWLLTYADMITLLFVLFVVLFAISSVNTEKFRVLKRTLREAFSAGVLSNGPSVLPQTQGDRPAPITEAPPNIPVSIRPPAPASLSDPNASPQQALESRQLEDVKHKVEKAADAAGLRQQIQATVNERGLAIRILTDGVLFDSGSATLRPEGQKVLGPIVASMRGMQNAVRIEGHTDANPIHTAQFRNNRWLGSARANAVADHVISRGLPAKRVIPLTYGAERPVASNATAAGRRQNRRIEILVLRQQGAPGQTPESALGG